MKVYSIKEPVNNFYIYQISNLTDPELVLEHFEHGLSIEDSDPLAKYLYDKWDDVEIAPAENLTARQYLDIVDKSGAGYDMVKNDPKCINVTTKSLLWRKKEVVVRKQLLQMEMNRILSPSPSRNQRNKQVSQ